MKQAEKLKVLQHTLHGQYGPLQELHHQKRKEATRYLDCVGMVDIDRCPPEFLDLIVSHSYAPESSNEDFLLDPLSTALRRYREIDPKIWVSPFNAVGLIDADDRQYDTLPLQYFRVQLRNYSYTYLPNVTVADLRRWFALCAASYDKPCFIGVLFETDFTWLDTQIEAKRLKQYEKSRKDSGVD